MIARARVPGARASRHHIAGVVLTLSGVVAAATLGALLGALGAAATHESRSILVGIAAVSLIGAVSTRVQPWQFDRETPQRWLEYGTLRVVVVNGTALGVGFLTRLGTWAFYALLVGVLATGSPILGALALSAYAATRLALSLLLILPSFRQGLFNGRQRIRSVTTSIDPLVTSFLVGAIALQIALL